ncbi:MAG: hypothetical protein EAZ18_00335 [Oscillatoriales cyanobacterium]|nr:MAG: hypothetical protein EAZ18_00335 [Oscillatoriales cyanobacterium]
MPTKTIKLYISKQDYPKPDLIEKVKSIFQDYLKTILKLTFEILNQVIKTGKSNLSESTNQKIIESIKQNPKLLKDWVIPTDAEFDELVKDSCCNEPTFGWYYRVIDEPTCVTAILELTSTEPFVTTGYKWQQRSDLPGLIWDERTTNRNE